MYCKCFYRFMKNKKTRLNMKYYVLKNILKYDYILCIFAPTIYL